MSDWCIRAVKDADIQAITKIYNYYVCHTDISFETEAVSDAEMHVRRAAIEPLSPYLVAILDGAVVGYAYAKPWHKMAAYAHTYESSIYLAHDRDLERCKGLGTALYRALIDGLRERGDVRILFGVPTLGNAASDRLHEKLGFTHQGSFANVGYKQGCWLSVTYWAYDFTKINP
ncbi:N-acetyltransferase family protein [Suttonella sp. R2A3]|uniref:GNAT family N-acetyltransferase n=1 Tax=Suttonella sp. R2A3 TaxID=2908648 RepID=UPI001F38A34E|nr:GNAT family N-acetyltransferase [Suttonella sp. R2A3]UJF24664.1 N-acetyltransferase family protein [Suttonella sp. R2A3]